MLVGYCRTSTLEQVAGLEAQHRQLVASGCTERIFSEQISSVAHRAKLEEALDFVREGDTLVVSRLDRLARSTADLLNIVTRLEQKKVGLRILDFGGSPVDTQSPTGRLTITIFGALGEWERSLMLARQREGIAKAKAEGRYKGRAPIARAKLPQIKQLRAQGVQPARIAEELRISRASVYRLLQDL